QDGPQWPTPAHRDERSEPISSLSQNGEKDWLAARIRSFDIGHHLAQLALDAPDSASGNAVGTMPSDSDDESSTLRDPTFRTLTRHLGSSLVEICTQSCT